MNYLFITVLIIGLSGLVAQALILRELLVSFYGNELTLGIVLANWIIAEAIGVFSVGKFIDRVKNKINPVRNTPQIGADITVSNGVNVFIILQILFSLSFPLSIYLARTFKYIIGIPFPEAMGLSAIFYSSFLIILPIGFCHGALFSTACKVAGSISKIYSWETIGTILGGIIFTYLFLPYIDSFQTVFIICVLNLIICLPFFVNAEKSFKYAAIFLIFLIIIFALGGGLKFIQELSIKKQWENQSVLADRNSIYGNIAVTKKEEQYTFFYNGFPVITVPYPDKQFVEDFGHLPLLFHQAPKDVLIISSGAGGLINEIIKHPLERIDYVEIDPLIIEMLKKFPTRLTESEFHDKRVNIINTDGRFFLRVEPKRYDVILIGLSNQSALSTNRFFTEEFFLLAKSRLNSGGILALWLPGSLTYLSRELIDLNYCILNGLKQDFEFVRIIPGDYNIFLASSDKSIMDTPASVISKRMEGRNIQTSLLKPAYLDYRLNKYWQDWFITESIHATKKINKDTSPIAVFESLILWNKKFSPKVKPILEFCRNINLKWVISFVILITLLLILIDYRFLKAKIPIAYGIATTGFFAMLTNLILIFGFQTFYGYLYQKIGLLISIFMAGIATGSIAVIGKIEKIKNALNFFIFLEALIIVFSYVMAMILTKLTWFQQYSSLVFGVLFFVSGLLAGLEFPIAGKMYLRDKAKVGEVSGILYCADLVGGWFAGILGGIVLLPVLGVFNTCLVIIMFKLSSVILLIALSRNKGDVSSPLFFQEEVDKQSKLIYIIKLNKQEAPNGQNDLKRH